eukprot:2599228-Rhodomonas_salina.1
MSSASPLSFLVYPLFQPGPPSLNTLRGCTEARESRVCACFFDYSLGRERRERRRDQSLPVLNPATLEPETKKLSTRGTLTEAWVAYCCLLYTSDAADDM